jgi:hypothetical protein
LAVMQVLGLSGSVVVPGFAELLDAAAVSDGQGSGFGEDGDEVLGFSGVRR